jgi:hypothetical protein
VVAIAGPLFEAFLEDDDLTVWEVRRALLHWSYPPSELGRVVIDVLVKGEVDAYASQLRNAHNAALSHGAAAAREVVLSSEYLGSW